MKDTSKRKGLRSKAGKKKSCTLVKKEINVAVGCWHKVKMENAKLRLEFGL